MFKLTIVTPEKRFYEGDVGSLIVSGSEGYLGVLTDHAPLITAVIPGKVTIKDKSNQEIFLSVSFGFFEVSSNHATLLADSVEFLSDIDLERAQKALDRARQRLANQAGDIDLPRAQKAMERARNRITLATKED
ncbi:MAG: ATP synthase F1 subunit epsilon [candidate division Zixibacteria bacterium HGW-Zixibacteria-1]|nr:MAG: ATP synthase F1 subunit epsilon [candidate division Zixibacteria bacterium HGW-Zixibacteria-1]